MATLTFNTNDLFIRCGILHYGGSTENVLVFKLKAPHSYLVKEDDWQYLYTVGTGNQYSHQSLTIFGCEIKGEDLSKLVSDLRQSQLMINREGYCYLESKTIVPSDPRCGPMMSFSHSEYHRINDLFQWSKYNVVMPEITTIPHADRRDVKNDDFVVALVNRDVPEPQVVDTDKPEPHVDSKVPEPQVNNTHEPVPRVDTDGPEYRVDTNEPESQVDTDEPEPQVTLPIHAIMPPPSSLALVVCNDDDYPLEIEETSQIHRAQVVDTHEPESQVDSDGPESREDSDGPEPQVTLPILAIMPPPSSLALIGRNDEYPLEIEETSQIYRAHQTKMTGQLTLEIESYAELKKSLEETNCDEIEYPEIDVDGLEWEDIKGNMDLMNRYLDLIRQDIDEEQARRVDGDCRELKTKIKD